MRTYLVVAAVLWSSLAVADQNARILQMCTRMKDSNRSKLAASCDSIKDKAKKDECLQRLPALVESRFESCMNVGRPTHPALASR
jgi:hypothetical protein